MTGADRSFPALNAVRAVGALAVVATHVGFDTGEIGVGAHGAVLSRLDFGVALFFVISGFLLSRPFFLAREAGGPRPGYGHYLWKRALRVLPLYWATVVLALLVLPGNVDAGPGTWVRNLTLTQSTPAACCRSASRRCGACAPRRRSTWCCRCCAPAW